MKKYCVFLADIYDGEELIWKTKDRILITYEDENNYYFGKPVDRGIEKQYIDELFKVEVRGDSLNE